MSMNLTSVATVLVRMILFASGAIAFSLSFFHGPDLNILFFAGISMLIVAASPYAVTRTKLKIWGISTSAIAIILYSYLVTELFQDSDANKTAEVSDLAFGIPLLCLFYLIYHFAKSFTKEGAH